jgi:hypothetical protein
LDVSHVGGKGGTVGIRLQRLDGSERLYDGSEEGLFLLIFLRGRERLLVVDGPADTAAALDLGFEAVGRPSWTGGIDFLVDLVGRLQVPEVVFVTDPDERSQHGTRRLATTLASCCPTVRFIVPPAGIRGIRNWRIRGATAADVEAAINLAPVERS